MGLLYLRGMRRAWALYAVFGVLWFQAAAQPGNVILSSFTVQQIGDFVRADFGILGGASCFGAELQRSTDNEMTWETVASISGVCGGSEFTEYYTFNDYAPVHGTSNMYRLELGGVGRTMTLEVFFTALDDGILLWHNPVSDRLNIRWEGLPTKRHRVVICDSRGTRIEAFDVVGNTAAIDLSRHPPGIYMLYLFDDTHQLLKSRRLLR